MDAAYRAKFAELKAAYAKDLAGRYGRLLQNLEKAWILSDGTALPYANWADKSFGQEPNNGGKQEHWIQLNAEKGNWFDESAGKRVGFLCEWDF